MKITLCGSGTFRKEMVEYKKILTELDHEVIIHPDYEASVRDETPDMPKKIQEEGSVAKRKYGYIRRYYDAIVGSDAILVLNFDKSGIAHYIGGNTLMEIGFAHVHGKKIFLLHQIPDISYTDEIKAM